jgi:hypothetical protein
MLRKLRSRLTYANVMSTLAVFLALGGVSAYAANEWTGDNIVDGSLTGADIFNNTVSGADITNGSLTGADVFDNTIGGADITNGSLTGADVADTSSLEPGDIHEEALLFNNTLNSNDIGPGAVGTSEVSDGSLNDEDIAQGTFNFEANIGTVPGGFCIDRQITGINAQGDHLLLTPNDETDHPSLTYEILYRASSSDAWIKVCNHRPVDIDDGNTTFNLLVFDAQ